MRISSFEVWFDVPEKEFKGLKKLYPTGKYDKAKTTEWFDIEIKELTITFMKSD